MWIFKKNHIQLFFVISMLMGISSCSNIPYYDQLWGQNTHYVYDVKSGDTIYRIAKSENIPMKILIDYNRLQPPYVLKVGQKLKIPNITYYTVQNGDSMSVIAQKHGIDLDQILSANRMHMNDQIRAGQKVIIPPADFPVSGHGFSGYGSGGSSKPKPRPGSGSGSGSSSGSKPSSGDYKGKHPDFIWPIKGEIIKTFGTKNDGTVNEGINISGYVGMPIYAALDGYVVYAGDLKGFGRLVLVQHRGGWKTAYAHMQRIMVNVGDRVRKKQIIGLVGQTGYVKSPQLHFQIRYYSKTIDPSKILDKK